MKEKRKREMIGFVMFVFSVLLLRSCVLVVLFYIESCILWNIDNWNENKIRKQEIVQCYSLIKRITIEDYDYPILFIVCV